MIKQIKESSTLIKADTGKISKKLKVFYNPVMKFNRDISILLLNVVNKNNLQIALPLAGSGIRGIRFFKELKKGKIKTIYFNDYSESAVKMLKENLKLNKINTHFEITNKDANIFLLGSSGFDYIDIDPFGTPNPFLDSAVKRLARDGILAVTATDTSALCGTHLNACQRKYWATPSHTAEMREIGLRILIRKIQLIASQYEKALTPIFSYSKDHYIRVFLKCEKGKNKADKIIEQHNYYNSAGPIWTGQLFDKRLANKIFKLNKEKNNYKFLNIIKNELDIVGFYEIHSFCKTHKLKIPKTELLIKKIRKQKFKAAKTHFSDTGIKSNIKEKDLINTIKKVN
ncbi:hypothetical protein KY345_03305 [Candidatus Woesearchaeota archaeon]|nr:hypothetical protein [Candidatus Woesearchaeota archaeon]